MGLMQIQAVCAKALALAIACLLVAGCVFGDRIYSSNINVSFPKMTKEQVVPLVLDAGFTRGYRRVGEWQADGLSLDAACGRMRDGWFACRNKFMENAIWSEAKEYVTDNAIIFLLHALQGAPRSFTIWIKIEDVVGGCRVEFDIHSIGVPLKPEEKAEFSALRHLLVERYGSMVTAREDQ